MRKYENLHITNKFLFFYISKQFSFPAGIRVVTLAAGHAEFIRKLIDLT